MPWLEPENTEEFMEIRWVLLCMIDDSLSANRINGDSIEGELSGAFPTAFALHRNYPNPFNPDTEIKYDLRETSNVRLEIFNIAGQKVCTLMDGMETAGYKTATWNGRTNGGKSAASGIYIYKLTADGLQSGEKFVQSMKMTLLQ